MKTTLLILTTAVLLYWGIVWDTGKILVEPGPSGVCCKPVKRAIKHMGDKKNFRIVNGQLQVEVNGKYLRLKRR